MISTGLPIAALNPWSGLRSPEVTSAGENDALAAPLGISELAAGRPGLT